MRPFYEAAWSGFSGLSDPRSGHFGSEMLQIEHMTPTIAPTWIQDEEQSPREDVVLTTAELAECTCPDPCECDHDN
jgi:hypothetical protein